MDLERVFRAAIPRNPANPIRREIGRSIEKAKAASGRVAPQGNPRKREDIQLRSENRFHRSGDRAMSVHDGRGAKPLSEKEILT